MDTRTLIRHVVIGYYIAPTLSFAAEIPDSVRATIAQRLPGLAIESVSDSPLPGILVVSYDGRVISGYRPAQELRDSLDADKVGASR